MTARQRGWVILPASAALVAGVFLGRNTTDPLLPLIACVPALISLLLLRGWGRLFSCVVFSFVLGVCAGSYAFHPSLPPEGDYGVTGVISDEITLGSFGQHRVYLSDVTLDGQSHSGGAYWTFYLDETPEDLLPGRTVSFTASLYHPRVAVNPDGYHQQEVLLQRGVNICLYGRDRLMITDTDHFSFSGTVAALRHRLSAAMIRALGQETGSYAAALLLGMRSLIPSEDRQAFSRLGIAHILSVSGFHVGVLIGALSLLFRLLRLRPRTRLLFFAVILFAYAALCGMSQPVIRASLLLLLTLEGKMLNRPRSGLHLLCATLYVMTLFSPVQVTSASFQLTFCAMFGLIWFTPLSQRMNFIQNRALRAVLRSLVITFGVQLGLLFPELMFFQRLPLLVFLTNPPAVLISSALIILFWLVTLLLPFPALAGLLSVPLSAVTSTLLSGIRRLSALPGLTCWIQAPTPLTILAVALLFLGLCSFLRLRRPLRVSLSFFGAALLVISLLPGPHTATEYLQFSVGNADAAVLWDQDRLYVIDAGEADGTVSGWLRRRRLIPDAVILTHLHTDHAGGLQSLIEDEIPIPLLLLPTGADQQQIHPDMAALLESLQASGTEIRFLSRGDVIPLPSGSLTVLWPEKDKVRPSQDANRYSLVSRLILKGTVLLQTGDIDGSYESYCAAPADILKAAHHGSPYSTASAFLDAVSPSAILLSCQRDSRLQDFRERVRDIPVYGTPESGAITIRFEEGSFTVLPFLTDD